MQQNEALDLLKTGHNIFLTGAAGSGKTYLLNKYIKYLKDNNVTVAITASTGIAATHLQGVTLHSWSGIGVKDSLSRKDLEKLQTNSRIKRNYQKTKVLIIDEISMLHKHQLDMVDTIARHMLDSEAPFGGIQVVLCGDFFQLPPVSSGLSSEDIQFAFEGSAWEQGDFYVCYLQEQHRQGNDQLLSVLNDIRSGTAGEHTKVPLRTRYKKEPQGETKPTKLYSRNINVDAINERELANLPGPEKLYDMASDGFGALVEGLKKSCLAVERLTLKKDAQVMFIKNEVLGAYVNGTRGVVVGFDKTEDWPIVKTYDGKIIIAEEQEWKLEDNGVVRATLMQVPLRLAWAITIHKSQGMTLDAAEIDLGDAFEPGMGYVALSRVRSLNGLKLMNLNEMALTVHPKILEHDKYFKECSAEAQHYLQTLSAAEKEKCHHKTLVERFEGDKNKEVSKEKSKRKKPASQMTHMQTLDLLKQNLSITSIAAKRELSMGTILSHLDKLKGSKQLDEGLLKNLKFAIPEEDFDSIYAELEKSEDQKLKTIYDKFQGKYSYTSIQIVRLFL